MDIRILLASAAAALSTGCASTHASRSSLETIQLDRVNFAAVDIGSVPAAQLSYVLPRALARHGYFLSATQGRGSDALQFVTDWRLRPALANEGQPGAEQARTRLVVDARRRGERYHLTLYAVTHIEDAQRVWRTAPPTPEVQRLLHVIRTDIDRDFRTHARR